MSANSLEALAVALADQYTLKRELGGRSVANGRH